MKSRGFTLVELAIVIAIVAILAAVAIPRFTDVSAQAEEAMINDFVAQLQSASAMYTARMSRTPDGFTDFVTNSTTMSTTPSGNTYHTLSVANFGSNAKNGQTCTVAAATITCNSAFNKWNATYSFNGGAFTSTKTAK